MNLCPRCRTPLARDEYQGVELEACGRCGGQWLGPDRLKVIVDETPPPRAEDAERLRSAGRGRMEVGPPCPSCGEPMEPFDYAGDSGVFLDRCRTCDGIWLDGGRLEEVRRFAAAARAGVERDAERFGVPLHAVEVDEDRRELEEMDAPPPPGLGSQEGRPEDERTGL